MANIASNPWSFVSTDPATAVITGGTGLTLNADGTVSVTTTGALTFNTTTPVPPNWFTVINATAPAYNGFYYRVAGASGASAFTLQPQFAIASGTAQSGAGTIAQCLYPWQVRAEDMSWQNPTAAGQLLDYRDRMGNIIWQATSTGAGSQNRGKIFWVNGITPVLHGGGVLLVTVN